MLWAEYLLSLAVNFDTLTAEAVVQCTCQCELIADHLGTDRGVFFVKSCAHCIQEKDILSGSSQRVSKGLNQSCYVFFPCVYTHFWRDRLNI